MSADTAGPTEIHSLLTRMIAINPNVRPSLAEARATLEVAGENLRQRNQGIAVAALVALGILAAVGLGKKK